MADVAVCLHVRVLWRQWTSLRWFFGSFRRQPLDVSKLPKNKIRRYAVLIVSHLWFERLIVLAIAINSVMLAAYDPTDVSNTYV